VGETILLAGTGYSSLPDGPWNVGDVAQAMGLAERIRGAFPEATLKAVPPDPDHVPRAGVELLRAPAEFLAPGGGHVGGVRYARRGMRSVSLLAAARRAKARRGDGGSSEALAALAGASALVLCGMGDLCDGFAYLGAARWGVPAAAAEALGVPVFASGQQVGPLARPDARSIARLALRRVRTVGVRDPVSLEVASSLGVVRSRLVFTGDDAWDLPAADPTAADRVLSEAGIEGPFVAVNARLARWVGFGPDDVRAFAVALDELARTLELPILFVPMLAGPNGDARSGEILRRLLRARVLTLPGPLDPPTTKALVARASVVVGSGYHLCLLASSVGVPAVGVYRSAYMRQKMRGLPILAPGRATALALDGGSARRLPDAARAVVAGSATVSHDPLVPHPEGVLEALGAVL
jgi:polysaccharide pyruvyl transferase WcaK-like protein